MLTHFLDDRTYVIRGVYPEEFLALWDDFDDWKGSESARPRTSF